MNEEFHKEFNYWPTFSDLGISIIFILILYLILQQITFYLTDAYKLQKIAQYQIEFIKELKNDLGKDSVIISNVKNDNKNQIISFKETFLFDNGKSEFKSPASKDFIIKIGRVIEKFAKMGKLERLIVEGHTDSTPINFDEFGNWNLSANRAVTVVRILDEINIREAFRQGGEKKPSRALSISGYSQYDYKSKPESETLEDKEASRRIQFFLEYKMDDK